MNEHDILDDFKRRAALAVLERVDLATLRQVSLDNLTRWKAIGAWCSAYDEWVELLTTGSEDAIRHTMSAHCENANRLRQSAPYAGILDEPTRAELMRQARNAFQSRT